MISLIENSSTRIIISIPFGKPRRDVSLNKNNLFSRELVPRPPQKGMTSAFYALNMIRLRIGPYPTGYLQARKIEILASKVRKKISRMDESLPITLEKCIRTFAFFLKKPLEELLAPSPLDTSYSWKVLEYLLYKELYQMQFSSWRPSDPLSSLINSLQGQGPMIVNLHNQNSLPKHIVIIGAETLTSGHDLVHYLDPIDGGKEPKTLPYNELQKTVANVYGEDAECEAEPPFGWQVPFVG